MSNFTIPLRWILIGDAAASGATALLVIVAADVLQPWLGLPTALLRGAGLVLVPYVVLVAYVAARRQMPAPAVGFIIACNFIWAAASILLLVSGAVAPTLLGYVFVAGQAAVVAVFGELQLVALRRPHIVQA